MILSIRTRDGEYPILLERGALSSADRVCDFNRKCMIVTDENIPLVFQERLAALCREAHVFVMPVGEEAKSLSTAEACLKKMLALSFDRSDCVIALGGGVVGDLAGLVASLYQRGVDFYNVPTTLLSQVDSSVGGKVAVNFEGLKNMLGTFYPPRAVVIDPDTLQTLPRRQINCGLAEALKMAVCLDEEAFELFLEKDPLERVDAIIEKSIRIKARVVEEDERETGLRKVLNFGHTLAHAMEMESARTGRLLYHGECVAVGMLPVVSPPLRKTLCEIYSRIGLPVHFSGDVDRMLSAMRHDKKVRGERLTVVRSDKVGTFRFDEVPLLQWEQEIRRWMQ